jgi:hypothetical protein
MMERYESYWKGIKGSEPVETFGFEGILDPEPVNVNLPLMIELFKTGYQQFSSLWKDIFKTSSFDHITETSKMGADDFYLPTEAWVKILYELAATHHLWTVNRSKLLDMMTPLYFARVASFVRQTREMTSREAEILVEDQAVRFEEQKDYLVNVWNEKSAEKVKAGFECG